MAQKRGTFPVDFAKDHARSAFALRVFSNPLGNAPSPPLPKTRIRLQFNWTRCSAPVYAPRRSSRSSSVRFEGQRWMGSRRCKFSIRRGCSH